MIKNNIGKFYNYTDAISAKNILYRWIVFFLIIFIYFIVDKFSLIESGLINELIFLLCMFLLIGFNYFLHIIRRTGEITKFTVAMIILFDLLITSMLIIAVGRQSSPYFVLYFLLLLNVNIIYDSKKTIFIFISCLVIYMTISFYGRMDFETTYSKIIILINIFSFLIYFLTFEWARQWKKKTQYLNATISEKKKNVEEINTQLSEQKIALAEKNKHYLDMLGLVTHELKSPLVPIQSISSYRMTDSEISEELRNDFQRIFNNAIDQTKMIETFLTLSKIEQGVLLIDYQRLEIVSDAIEYSITQLEPEAKKKNMNMLKHPGSEIGSVVTRSDPKLLKIVFNNLFSNAIKYGLKNTDITYKLNFKDDKIEIIVTNQGEEIPQNKIEKIFEKFERLDSAKQSNIPGTGLGLFNTKSIVEKLNGKIYCESQTYWTSFIVQLPIEGGEYNDDDDL